MTSRAVSLESKRFKFSISQSAIFKFGGLLTNHKSNKNATFEHLHSSSFLHCNPSPTLRLCVFCSRIPTVRMPIQISHCCARRSDFQNNDVAWSKVHIANLTPKLTKARRERYNYETDFRERRKMNVAEQPAPSEIVLALRHQRVVSILRRWRRVFALTDMKWYCDQYVFAWRAEVFLLFLLIVKAPSVDSIWGLLGTLLLLCFMAASQIYMWIILDSFEETVMKRVNSPVGLGAEDMELDRAYFESLGPIVKPSMASAMIWDTHSAPKLPAVVRNLF